MTTHPAIIDYLDISHDSSWRAYRRGLLELELDGVSEEAVDAFTKKSAKESFLVYAKHIIGNMVIERFHEVIGSAFENIAKGTYPILMVSMPPRSGKTSLGSLLLSWLKGKDSAANHFASSYCKTMSDKIVKTTEMVVDNQKFQDLFPVDELNSGSILPVTEGESVCGYGYGGFNGVPGIWLIDDYHRYSENLKVDEEHMKEIKNKRLGSNAIVVLGTRYGEGDIFDYFLNKYGIFDPESNPTGVVHINLSAIIETEGEEEADVLGRKIGSTLWPMNSSFNAKMLQDQKRVMGETKFSWLYKGCSPKESKFVTEEEISTLSRIVISIDPAYYGLKDNTGICVSGVTEKKDILYVLEAFEGNWDTNTVAIMVDLLSKAYGTKRVLIAGHGGSDCALWTQLLSDKGITVNVSSNFCCRANRESWTLKNLPKIKFSESALSTLEKELDCIAPSQRSDAYDAFEQSVHHLIPNPA